MKLSIVASRIVWVALSFFVSGASLAIEIDCPARISMRPIVVDDVPEGWRSSQTATTLPVWGAGITVGPLEKGGVFKPEMYESKGRKTLNWQFVQADNDRGIWLTCGYGGSPVELARKLPEGISTCTAYPPDHLKGEWTVTTVCE